jgi:NAD(P)-dependent dehydrogenase (short-subunit alcohol dehydrogenase family)
MGGRYAADGRSEIRNQIGHHRFAPIPASRLSGRVCSSFQIPTDSAIRKIVEQNGRLDVVVHNGGHMVFGPAEAFTPEQFAELYDVNVLDT